MKGAVGLAHRLALDGPLRGASGAEDELGVLEPVSQHGSSTGEAARIESPSAAGA